MYARFVNISKAAELLLTVRILQAEDGGTCPGSQPRQRASMDGAGDRSQGNRPFGKGPGPGETESTRAGLRSTTPQRKIATGIKRKREPPEEVNPGLGFEAFDFQKSGSSKTCCCVGVIEICKLPFMGAS